MTDGSIGVDSLPVSIHCSSGWSTSSGAERAIITGHKFVSSPTSASPETRVFGCFLICRWDLRPCSSPLPNCSGPACAAHCARLEQASFPARVGGSREALTARSNYFSAVAARGRLCSPCARCRGVSCVSSVAAPLRAQRPIVSSAHSRVVCVGSPPGPRCVGCGPVYVIVAPTLS